jgi:hypothetical protein
MGSIMILLEIKMLLMWEIIIQLEEIKMLLLMEITTLSCQMVVLLWEIEILSIELFNNISP